MDDKGMPKMLKGFLIAIAVFWTLGVVTLVLQAVASTR